MYVCMYLYLYLYLYLYNIYIYVCVRDKQHCQYSKMCASGL